MWKALILLLLPFSAGNLNGVCVEQERKVEYIEYGRSTVPRTRWVPREVCCSGYKNVNGTCQPICDPECVMGTCVLPEQCECNFGWTDPLCSSAINDCVDGFYGLDCLTPCDCNGSKCDQKDGKCICRSGYHGEKCELPCVGYTGINCTTPCPEETYGANCSQKCMCENGSECDKVNGTCSCQSGFMGTFCQTVCPPGSWGVNCSHKCDCGDSQCDVKTGNCYCPPGFTGTQCIEHCQPGFCGEQCAKNCNCVHGKCSFEDCTCNCDEGWIGVNCTERCQCVSENTEKCDLITGTCTCKPGWKEIDCSIPACSCVESNTRSCTNGTCICHPGWTGANCEKQCDPGYYGENCTALCMEYGSGNYICDPIIGDICGPNFKGNNCSVCTCGPNAVCNFLTGNCDCNAGYYGEKCSSPCLPNKYGKNCTEECVCDGCRSTDGHCKCQKGWNGAECPEYCPVEFYDIVNKVCVTRSIVDPYPILVQAGVLIPWHLVIIGNGIIVIILVTVGGIIVYKKCVKTRYDGMINVNAAKIELPYTSPVQNMYEREENHYETIPDGSIAPNYDMLNRHTHMPLRYQDPTYFVGYEQPNLEESFEMRRLPPDYIQLDRNSIGPVVQEPYRTFKNVQL